ncbi:MAG: hypothetical protein ING22_01645, partial [Burkholderiales bacterium]|nr:hypothetical protein [Burkholderiales bacterium]
LLSEPERLEIDARLNALQQAEQQLEQLVLKQAIDAVSQATEEFAARRMNRSIQQALTGRSLEDLSH